jgi:hypothetical protein
LKRLKVGAPRITPLGQDLFPGLISWPAADWGKAFYSRLSWP